MYKIKNNTMMQYPSCSHTHIRTHYGITLYSKLPVMHSSQPVTMADFGDSVECTLLQVALTPDTFLSIGCVYRSPKSDLKQFRLAMA